jgi:hypothetical protein
MISYADKTFCAGDGCAAFRDCSRALTQDVRERAKAKGLPIAQFVDPKKNHCYVEPKIKHHPREVGEEEMLLADGFDEALIGTARRLSGTLVAVYDRNKCIEILARDMSPEEAEEYFEFNVEGAWMGEGTPIFIDSKSYE